NNDGLPDLLVARFGHPQLFQNLGKCRFKDVTSQAGLDRYLNAITAIAFDYDHDGFVDLFIGSYFQSLNIFKPTTPKFFPESFENAKNGGGVVLFRNNVDGAFRGGQERAGVRRGRWTAGP